MAQAKWVCSAAIQNSLATSIIIRATSNNWGSPGLAKKDVRKSELNCGDFLFTAKMMLGYNGRDGADEE